MKMEKEVVGVMRILVTAFHVNSASGSWLQQDLQKGL